MKNQGRVLAEYVRKKMAGKVTNLNKSDLIRFFNDNGWYLNVKVKGWYLYDIDKMAQNFEKWRHKHKYYSS